MAGLRRQPDALALRTVHRPSGKELLLSHGFVITVSNVHVEIGMTRDSEDVL
jgi:hypothetical protein